MKTLKIKLCIENDFREIDLLTANHVLTNENEIDKTDFNLINELLMNEYKKGLGFYEGELITKINYYLQESEEKQC